MSGCRKQNGCNKSGRPSDSARLFDVTLQHDQKFLQLLSSFRRRMGVLNAVLHVRVDQSFRQRLDGLSRGHQLHEDFRAVAVFLQHPLNGVHLSDDAAHPNLLGIALAPGMSVLFHGTQK